MQREAGHEMISQTLGYAKEVQDRGGRSGAPFPELPADLTDPSPGAVVSSVVRAAANSADSWSGRRDRKRLNIEGRLLTRGLRIFAGFRSCL